MSSTPWSDEKLRERLKQRAGELNRSVRSILAGAGMPLDLLHKTTSQGRRVDTLERLAVAFEWSLPELMGFEVIGRISEDVAQRAYQIVVKTLANVPDFEQILIPAFCQVYNILASLKRDGKDIADDNTIDTLERSVAETWGAGARRR